MDHYFYYKNNEYILRNIYGEYFILKNGTCLSKRFSSFNTAAKHILKHYDIDLFENFNKYIVIVDDENENAFTTSVNYSRKLLHQLKDNYNRTTYNDYKTTKIIMDQLTNAGYNCYWLTPKEN